jgi:hypothetical protein
MNPTDWGAVAAATWFESLAVASRRLHRRPRRNNLLFRREAHEAQGTFRIRKRGIEETRKTSCVPGFLIRILPRRHGRCDGKQRHDREMFGAVLFVRNDQ